jgi:hypothetical protein
VVSNGKRYDEFSCDVFLEKEEALGMLCAEPVIIFAENSGTEKGTGQIFTQSAFIKSRDSSVGIAADATVSIMTPHNTSLDCVYLSVCTMAR